MLRLRDVLKRLGWSQYERDAYCSLVTEGASTAADLELRANIPSGRGHSVVKKLKARKEGAVRKLRGRPAKFDAQNPRMVLEAALNDLKEECEAALAEAEPAWDLRAEGSSSNHEKSWIVDGLGGTVNEVRELALRSTTAFTLVLDNLTWIKSKDIEVLKKIIEKGGIVKVVSTRASKSDLERLAAAGVIAKAVDQVKSGYAVSDHKTVLWVTGKSETATALVDERLAGVLEREFEADYKDAASVEVEKV